MDTIATEDLKGRAYAKLSALKPGDKVQTDDLITCRKTSTVSTVRKDGDGRLSIPCSHGGHTLDGQAQDDGDTLAGVYPVS